MPGRPLLPVCPDVSQARVCVGEARAEQAGRSGVLRSVLQCFLFRLFIMVVVSVQDSLGNVFNTFHIQKYLASEWA